MICDVLLVNRERNINKVIQLSLNQKSSNLWNFFTLIYVDLRMLRLYKNTYILVNTDNFSRFTWVFFLRQKFETAQVMIDFIKNIELSLNKKVQRIKSDKRSEFKNKILDSFLTEVGISHNFSSIYTPQQTVVVERRNRYLCEAIRSMLTYANLLQYLWA